MYFLRHLSIKICNTHSSLFYNKIRKIQYVNKKQIMKDILTEHLKHFYRFLNFGTWGGVYTDENWHCYIAIKKPKCKGFFHVAAQKDKIHARTMIFPEIRNQIFLPSHVDRKILRFTVWNLIS